MMDDNKWIVVKKKQRNHSIKSNIRNDGIKNVQNFENNKYTPPSFTYVPEKITIYEISQEFKKELQKARTEKNLSRKKLAQMINEKESVISMYENGTGTINHNIIRKLNNVLGVNLPKLRKFKKEIE
jgi:ribosome-binding protein aMBF1 (putative translation factor)